MLTPQRHILTWCAYLWRNSGDLLNASSIKSAASANRPVCLALNAFCAKSFAIPSSGGVGKPNTAFDGSLDSVFGLCADSWLVGFQFSKAIKSSLAVG